MSSAVFDPDIAKSASTAQGEAADPSASVFVEANAGSGKTRVLVDRVVNILLGGTAPERILCVTYTKAAAAEMKERLFDRLGRWSVAPDEDLEGELNKLGLGREDLPRARRLFAKALETPGGLKIQTIHAFCENLLRRFPIEAGAPPGFETLDEAQADRLVAAARRTALEGIGPDAIPILLAHGGVEAVDTVLRWARSNRHALRGLVDAAGGVAGLIDRLYETLAVDRSATLAAMKGEAWQAAPRAALEEAAHALKTHGGSNDQTRAAQLQLALNASDSAAALDHYLPVFFTSRGEGSRAKSLVGKACAGAAPPVPPLLEAEAERMEAVRETLRAIAVAEGSASAVSLAVAFLDAYEDELARHRALDFDDLVRLAGALLDPRSAFAGWVGYKLDAALEHALVDEAQDTAPPQWDMIRGLTEEFFAGDGARDKQRTLFIVGDEKQSIYSFQGAESARFLEEGELLARRAGAAGLKSTRPELDVSFRSAPEVLSAVDQAFADLAGVAPETKFQTADQVRPFAHYHGHRAARSGSPGCVELWPAVPKPEKLEETSIFDPVDAPRRGSARDVLAESVAREIADMLARGDAVWEETGGVFRQRAMRPGDIGILVWRRTGGFFEEVIRQLKLAGVPVAGADRMVLCEQTAVKDLIALGRFAVTPGDDLALAEVLKSPFFDADDGAAPAIGDDALLDLARSRKSTRRGSLWAALFTSEDKRFSEARDALADWRNRADSDGLYDLFAGFLNARSATGETRWARMFARLGEEARDPVEEFLARALEHERDAGGALASFIAAIETDDAQLKREMSTGRDEVQVMTVHASKGLERPVIILPDTTRSPVSGRPENLFAHPEAGLLWSPRKAGDPPAVAALREERLARQRAEHERLLYVALTRARDRLIVCGWRHGHGQPGQIAEDSWYTRLKQAWTGNDWAAFETPLGAVIDEIEPGLRLGPAPAMLGSAAVVSRARPDLPAWAMQSARTEAAPKRSLAPSSLLESEAGDPPVLSPLADPDGYRYRRGTLIHKLLETLPDLAPERRRTAAERFAASQTDIAPETRTQIVEETLGILDHAEFAPLFGPGSRPEVSLTGTAPGLPGGAVVRGQVDRLVVTETEVLIIDYKTNRPPPEHVDNVPAIYRGQMAAYREMLRALHPAKTVRCALLWTDSTTLMELPDAMLDAALAGAPA